MKRNLLLVMVAFAVMVSMNFAAGKGPDDKVADTEAKALFVDNKCNSCHSISKAGVDRKGGTQSSKIPDLSAVGSKHDADWMSKFLKKETDMNGKKHTVPWKGTDEQLATMTAWLATLKADTSATGATGAAGGTTKAAKDTVKAGMKDTTRKNMGDTAKTGTGEGG